MDFSCRYAADKGAASAVLATRQAKPVAARTHGGGNAFMRAPPPSGRVRIALKAGGRAVFISGRSRWTLACAGARDSWSIGLSASRVRYSDDFDGLMTRIKTNS